MAAERIFVGRKAELEQFKKVLEDPQGQAILVVGQAGMGKSWLINKMAELAENHPKLKCGWVRYEVTPTDSVDSTMALMMDNAFEAATTKPGSFDKVPERKRQWLALLKLAKLIPAGKWVGKALGDKMETLVELWRSLQRNPARNTRDQFLERLTLVSRRMPENGRAIFVIDPEKYMQKESDQSWAIVVKNLPEKIKFVFAQRPEDVLVDSDVIDVLDNVVRIPGKDLDVLSEKDVDDLIQYRKAVLKCSVPDLRKVLSFYKGHPYAVGAALDLVEGGTKLEELPERPEPIKFAEKQWQKVCDNKDGAIELFEAYAILEVGIPDDVVEHVSGLKPAKRKRVMADKFMRGLLREEGYGKRIYHAILADYVLGQIGEEEKKEYHSRAVEGYRRRLHKDIKPDELAATRLAEHVLSAEGEKAFVYTFINECTIPLANLGLLDAVINLSDRARGMVKKGSEEETAVLGNLGLIYKTRGQLDKAKEMLNKVLKIGEKLGRPNSIADAYGNLGLIYQTRGELDKAEEMQLKSLEINKKLGRFEGMAIDYGNLGLIYRKRGQLDKAEEMFHKGLEIDEKLGRLKGIASKYGNLGLIYKTRGDLDKAEEMLNKSLEIAEKLGLQEIMAIQYGNLGVIYQTRGQLNKAEETHNKSLEINKKLGRLEGMANDYGNLGLIYQTRGDLPKAEDMYKKVLNIEEKLGRPESIAKVYGNLGVLYKTRGKLDKAEEMFLKIIAIHERLGSQEGLANDYGNLGSVYKQRGDKKKAREYWEKALDLYKKIGMPHMVKKVEGFIDGLEEK